MNSKKLVLSTLLVLTILGFIGLQFGKSQPLPPSIKIKTEGHPTIGYPQATVRVVIFDEPKCSDCKLFSDTIYPELKKAFIDTNKILYTFIPVSFIPGSMPAAMSWLSVYYQDKEFPNDELFFKYVDYMYANQPSEIEDWATLENLEKFAKEASPAIKIDHLHDALLHETYRVQIEKNTKYGFSIMNHRLATPAVYVDGIKIEDVSYSAIEDLINAVILQKGDHYEQEI
jgi:protein-disulfide isomerase